MKIDKINIICMAITATLIITTTGTVSAETENNSIVINEKWNGRLLPHFVFGDDNISKEINANAIKLAQKAEKENNYTVNESRWNGQLPIIGYEDNTEFLVKYAPVDYIPYQRDTSNIVIFPFLTTIIYLILLYYIRT